MLYEVEIRPRALKDGKRIPKAILKRIGEKIALLENDLQGDVRHLTRFSPEYRLRVGNYRVLFEVDGNQVVVYRIKHRKDAYK